MHFLWKSMFDQNINTTVLQAPLHRTYTGLQIAYHSLGPIRSQHSSILWIRIRIWCQYLQKLRKNSASCSLSQKKKMWSPRLLIKHRNVCASDDWERDREMSRSYNWVTNKFHLGVWIKVFAHFRCQGWNMVKMLVLLPNIHIWY
jgi:hypothetical protein